MQTTVDIPEPLHNRLRERAGVGSLFPTYKVSDCYNLTYARQCNAMLVTFDKGLRLARESGCSALTPV